MTGPYARPDAGLLARIWPNACLVVFGLIFIAGIVVASTVDSAPLMITLTGVAMMASGATGIATRIAVELHPGTRTFECYDWMCDARRYYRALEAHGLVESARDAWDLMSTVDGPTSYRLATKALDRLLAVADQHSRGAVEARAFAERVALIESMLEDSKVEGAPVESKDE